MDIYATVTKRILEQLDQGVVPWRKTWFTGLPKSLTTGKEYRLFRARNNRYHSECRIIPSSLLTAV
jgi:antirestriction protein ArdC